MNYIIPLILFILMPFFTWVDADAQRNVTYQELRARSEQPNVYMSHLALPDRDGSTLFTLNFRLDYDLLPFRRVRSDQPTSSGEGEFISSVRINMEIFKGSAPVTRRSWTDTIHVDTYEQTRSQFDHAEGMISTTLDADEYRLLTDFNTEGSQTLRQSGRRNQRSNSPFRERQVDIPDFDTYDQGVMALLDRSTESDDQYQVRLFNYGESVLYGQDYQLLILLPEASADDNYSLKIEKLQAGSTSETEGDPIFETDIERSEIIYTDGFAHMPDSNTPELLFDIKEEGFPVIIADIPNSQFPNARFKLTLTAGDDDADEEPVAEKVISSEWIDMPVSLLNLDMAIEMLRFMIDDDEIRQMRRGSRSEQEQRFREFWAERDPTPDTEYNELMSLYYSRIDQAFNDYTTPERPGFDSDQGRAFILYGSPDRKERQYLTNGPTREIWEYNNRTLVFEATSGFGDFRLVQQD